MFPILRFTVGFSTSVSMELVKVSMVTAVTTNLDRSLSLPHSCGVYNCAVQSQKAVTAYFSSKQLLLFGFIRQICRPMEEAPGTVWTVCSTSGQVTLCDPRVEMTLCYGAM